MPSKCSVTDSINTQILKVVEACKGKKIDRGECWALAKYALDAVGAKWDSYLNYGKQYDWKKDCMQAGDILQFEKVEFVYVSKEGKATESFYHHTAIVYSLKEDGVVELIHQNTGQFGKKVGVSSIDFKAMKKGTIKAYRPVK